MSLPGRWLATVARCVGRRDTWGGVLGVAMWAHVSSTRWFQCANELTRCFDVKGSGVELNLRPVFKSAPDLVFA
jgi:hypothetical protein